MIGIQLAEPTGYEPFPIHVALGEATGEPGPSGWVPWVCARWPLRREGIVEPQGTSASSSRQTAFVSSMTGERGAGGWLVKEPVLAWGHAPRVPPTETSAGELRRISGLPVSILAEILGVSRVSFGKWEAGANPRASAHEHLVQVLAQVRGAACVLPSTVSLANWLRTPVSAGAKRPVDYLAEKRYATFRGIVLREKSRESGFSPPKPTGFSHGSSSIEKRAAERDRLFPAPRDEGDGEPG